MGGTASKKKPDSPVKSTSPTPVPSDGMPNFAQARQPSIGKRPAVIPKMDAVDSLAPAHEDDDLDHNTELPTHTDDPPTPAPSSVKADDVEPMVVPVVAAPAAASSGLGRATKDKEEKTEKLFAAPKGPERSKLYQALNPTKLYYESARERAEAAEEKEVVSVRGGMGVSVAAIDYARARDAEGNLIEEEEEPEEEEPVDPKSLPELDPETMADLAKKRAERAEQEKKRQEELRAKFMAKKAEEESKRQEELKRIREAEAKQVKVKPTESAEFVEETLSRIEEESKANFRNFSFKT